MGCMHSITAVHDVHVGRRKAAAHHMHERVQHVSFNLPVKLSMAVHMHASMLG